MRFLFIVQGEGRGHMTQAISFSRMLAIHNHQLCGVVLGKSKRRVIPDFFIREIDAPIHWVESPNFISDKQEKRILLTQTILQNLKKTPIFWQSLRAIDRVVQSEKPDVILNFYDLLGGLYNWVFRPKSAFWVIGHQYLILHPDFIFAPCSGMEKMLFKLNTWATSVGAEERIALSFNHLPSTGKIRIAPPLLRPEIKNLEIRQGDFFLVYMVNSGYKEEVTAYAKANPQVKVKAYWDKKDASETEFPLPNLSLHRIHDRNFLADMASCRGLVCTAGFESICEAVYLGKPIMLIPVEGHYEQSCNALDAETAGIAIKSEKFDFGRFEQSLGKITPDSEKFRLWESYWSIIFPKITSKQAVRSNFMISLKHSGKAFT